MYKIIERNKQISHTKEDKGKIIESLKSTYTGETTSCSICLGDIADKDEIIQLKCAKMHVFHEMCIQNWFEVKVCCPICRKKC